MENTLTFKLDKKAKKSGGDKYICESNENFIIYFPQKYTRVNENPKEKLSITINN